MLIGRSIHGGGSYTLAPAGVHPAVCVDIVDLGKVKDNMSNELKAKCRIVWEIGAEDEKGERYTVSCLYNLEGLSPKSTLVKHLVSWRGRNFTDEELNRFDLDKVLGVPCELQIIHKEGKDTRTWANINAVLPAIKQRMIKPSGKYVRVKDRQQAQAAPQGQQPPRQPVQQQAPPAAQSYYRPPSALPTEQPPPPPVQQQAPPSSPSSDDRVPF